MKWLPAAEADMGNSDGPITSQGVAGRLATIVGVRNALLASHALFWVRRHGRLCRPRILDVAMNAEIVMRDIET